jgi:hypothetical protein
MIGIESVKNDVDELTIFDDECEIGMISLVLLHIGQLQNSKPDGELVIILVNYDIIELTHMLRLLILV